MKKTLKFLLLTCSGLLLGASAMAKLPALSDEAKAKAAEASAKAAWGGKVEAYLLCKSQDKTASHFFKTTKAAGKEVKQPPATPPCADPGPFVYPLPVATAPAPAAAPAAPAAAQAAKKP